MQPYFNIHKQLYILQQCVATEHQILLLPIICFYEVQGESENFKSAINFRDYMALNDSVINKHVEGILCVI